MLGKIILILVLCFSLMQSACVAKQRSTPSLPEEELHPTLTADIRILRSSKAQTAENAHGERAYISISDRQALAGQMQKRVERMLLEHHFTITDKPSQADRIINLTVLFKGKSEEAHVQNMVNKGYSGSSHITNSGTKAALVADLLLVRRRVPQQGKTNALKNISSRNALSSTQLRIGVLANSLAPLDNRSLEEALALDISRLAASDYDAKSHTSTLTKAKKPSKKVSKAKSSKKKKVVKKSSKKSKKKATKKRKKR